MTFWITTLVSTLRCVHLVLSMCDGYCHDCTGVRFVQEKADDHLFGAERSGMSVCKVTEYLPRSRIPPVAE